MNQQIIIILSIILLLPLIFVLFIAFIRYFIDIGEDIKYINMEINRTSGKERKYWKKEKRKILFGFLLPRK